VHRENGQRHLSLPVFSRSFLLHPPLMPVTPRLPPLPPPSRPNARQRWFVSTRFPPPPPPSRPNASQRRLLKSFRRDYYHHHLPRIQMRAGGGSFHCFDMTPTTTTSLASKREPEVVIFVLSTRLPQPPPPSRPNASRRWSFSSFQHDSHHHYLPRIQMRAGGGFFCSFNPSPTTTTSLASKRKPEVVFFCVSTRLPPAPPPSCPNMSWRWFFSAFRHPSHHYLPRIQTRARGSVFRRFDTSSTTITSLAFKREPEVVFFSVSTHLQPPPLPSHPSARRRWFFSAFRHPSHHCRSPELSPTPPPHL